MLRTDTFMTAVDEVGVGLAFGGGPSVSTRTRTSIFGDGEARNAFVNHRSSTESSTSGMFPTSSLRFVDTLEGEGQGQGRTEREQFLFSTRSETSTLGSSVVEVWRYSIFVFPSNDQDMQEICCSQIGQGGTMCVRKRCSVKHRGVKVRGKEGQIVVAKK
jgi:hypothetical protein